MLIFICESHKLLNIFMVSLKPDKSFQNSQVLIVIVKTQVVNNKLSNDNFSPELFNHQNRYR